MELKKTFIGGLMNKDYDVRLIPEGEYIDAENIIVSNSEGSNVGLVQKSNGLDKLTLLNLPSDAITIGSCVDEGNECIYWFVTSSIGNYIYEYNVLDNNSLSILLQDSRTGDNNVLNFDRDYKITGANIIYNSFNKEKLLVWTDDLNPIRCININRAKSYAINGFSTKDISLIKRAPFEAPICSPTTFGDGTENNIKERFLSFAYRYKYVDGEYSATSSFSNPQFYPSNFSFNYSTQENRGMVNSFNAVNINFNTGDKNVTDIQLLFKESNSSYIYVIDNFNKKDEGYGDNIDKTFLFSNNKIYSILPEDEVNRLYDNVPLVAKAQEFIGNRIIFGNYVEGRDLVDEDDKKIKIDFKTSFVSSDLKNNELSITVSDSLTTDDVVNILINKKDLVKGNILSMSFRATSDSPFFGSYLCDLSFYLEKSYANAYELSKSPEFTNFLSSVATTNFKNANLGNQEPANDVDNYPNKYNPFVLLTSTSADVISLKIPYIRHQIDETPSNSGDSLFTYQNEYYHVKIETCSFYLSNGNAYDSCKSNRSYECGIVYLDDDGRYSTVLTSKENTSFIPIKNSVTSNNLVLTIKNNPPKWANRYKIFVKDSRLDYQTIYSSIAYEENSFLWIKLEGQDKQKVKEGDYLIVKKNVDGPSDEVVKIQVLEYAVKEKDFILDNKNPAGEDIIEPAGVYIKVKSSSNLNISNIEKNFYDFEKESMDTGDNFFVLGGSAAGFSINKGTLSIPNIEDIPISSGSRISINITNTRSGLETVEFNKEYISSDEYDSFESWFGSEGDGLGDFKTYSFVRGFATPYDTGGGLFGGLPKRGENITLDPNGYLYLKIKNELNGNGQNRSFLKAHITITNGFSSLIFETDSKDNNSEVFYETQDTYRIENGKHLGIYDIDTDQGSVNVPAVIHLNWFNCYTQGNGAESYIVKDVFNKNFLSVSSRPNAVQLDGYKQVRNIASLTYSGPFDKTTSYNSLNEFNLSRANYKDLDDKYGSIQKIHSRDTDLVVFQEDKIHRILYNKNVLTDAVGGGQISSVEDVLGQEIPYAGEWGIGKNPESFGYYANSIYFTDSPKGAVLRLGGDGLEPISKYKMRDWFRDNLRVYKDNFKYGGYDPIHDNYVLSLSDQKSEFQNVLYCGQVIEWLNVNANDSYVYSIDLGNNIGNHVINYTIPSGKYFDFDVDINGTITSFTNKTGTGSLTVAKTTTESNGSLTIYNRQSTMGSLSITNRCVSSPELEVITLVANDDSDIGKSMNNGYYWRNNATSTNGESYLLDVFKNNVTRFSSDTGFEGENEIPYNNSYIKVSSNKGTGKFTSCNRIGYFVSSQSLTAQQILDSAIYPTITNNGDENYIEFTFTRSAGQKLYLVWDYIDVENCDVDPTPINLCYNANDYALACECDIVPVNCVVSDWGAWSACVNGSQTRTRTIITPASGGGTPCPALTETQSCQQPVNCVVSEWSAWSTCVDGSQTRTRTIVTPASGGGTPCPTLTETQSCAYKIRSFVSNNVINQVQCGGSDYYENTESITIQLTEADGVTPKVNSTGADIVINMLVDYSGCPSEYGNTYPMQVVIPNGQTQTYVYNTGVLNNCGGTGCAIITDTYSCYTSISPSYVQPTGSFFPQCVACNSYTVSTTSAGGQGYSYVNCDGTSSGGNIGGAGGYDADTFCARVGSVVLTGSELTLTDNGSCSSNQPVNCVVSDWSAWSECVNGTETRTRTIVTPASNGGAACPALSETRTCSGYVTLNYSVSFFGGNQVGGFEINSGETNIFSTTTDATGSVSVPSGTLISSVIYAPVGDTSNGQLVTYYTRIIAQDSNGTIADSGMPTSNSFVSTDFYANSTISIQASASVTSNSGGGEVISNQ